MSLRRTSLIAVGVALAIPCGGAQAQKKYDSGASDTEVKDRSDHALQRSGVWSQQFGAYPGRLSSDVGTNEEASMVARSNSLRAMVLIARQGLWSRRAALSNRRESLRSRARARLANDLQVLAQRSTAGGNNGGRADCQFHSCGSLQN